MTLPLFGLARDVNEKRTCSGRVPRGLRQGHRGSRPLECNELCVLLASPFPSLVCSPALLLSPPLPFTQLYSLALLTLTAVETFLCVPLLNVDNVAGGETQSPRDLSEQRGSRFHNSFDPAAIRLLEEDIQAGRMYHTPTSDPHPLRRAHPYARTHARTHARTRARTHTHTHTPHPNSHDPVHLYLGQMAK